MNKDIKKKWIAALRSGEYTQGQGCLKNDKSEYCCLGVLCDVAKKEGQEVVEKYNTKLEAYTFDGDRTFLPDSVVKWAGLDSFYVQVEYKDFPVSLDELNDERGLTFNEIADLIEEQL